MSCTTYNVFGYKGETNNLYRALDGENLRIITTCDSFMFFSSFPLPFPFEPEGLSSVAGG